MIINFLTIKTLSATRAFINGESTFSKSEKDGSRNLQLMIKTHDLRFFDRYEQARKIIEADSLALHGMINRAPDAYIISNLVRGRNNIDDAYDMLWMVESFKKTHFLRDIISIWRHGDKLAEEIHLRALQARQEIKANTYTAAMADYDSADLDQVGQRLTLLEFEFSDRLDHASRMMRQYLLITDFTMILLIIGIICFYSSITISRLFNAAYDLELQNLNLTNTNIELDRFVYSASHDLRAPITSLKGLLSIVMEEDDISEIKDHLKLMHTSLDQQDTFIQEIINYSRNKRTELNIGRINIRELVHSCIAQHQFMSETSVIQFSSELTEEEFSSDHLRLKIILNNLISNAVKFSDRLKAAQFIKVTCKLEMNTLKMIVEDNGIGIDEKYRHKVFDMFFVTGHSNRGSGLGLYITMETVSKLGGRIDLVTEKGRGTSFTVSVPLGV